MTRYRTGSARDRVRAYLQQNAGKTITAQHLRDVAGTAEYARHIRELRDDEGMQIETHRDAPDLKVGEYRLVSLEPLQVPVSRKVDSAQRLRILERDGFMCCLCTLAPGDPDPDNPAGRVWLHVDYIDPDGPSSDSNLRTTCNICREGRSIPGSVPPPKLTRVMSEARRLPRRDQVALMEGLERRLGGEQRLELCLDPGLSPGSWVKLLLQAAHPKSRGEVAQHLIGAKLERRHPGANIPTHADSAGDAQAEPPGDLLLGTTAFHVTAAPGKEVIAKCGDNLTAGYHPVLLVPGEMVERTRGMADAEGLADRITIASLEDFVAVNIIEMSTGDKSLFLRTLNDILDAYNRRIEAAETDQSLRVRILNLQE